MRRLLLLAALALGVSVWAATIQFDPAPVPLKGTRTNSPVSTLTTTTSPV